MRAASTPAMASTMARQPNASLVQASSGSSSSVPAAAPAVSAPVTTPRCTVNQRPATTGTSTMEITPPPSPATSPHSTVSCQVAVISGVAAAPATIRAREASTVRRTPQRSITATAKGPIRPYSSRLIPKAKEIAPALQPNSRCSGGSSTPGAARMPAEAASTSSVTPATTQA